MCFQPTRWLSSGVRGRFAEVRRMGFWVHGHNANGLPMEPVFSEAFSPDLARAEAERAGMVVERVEAEEGSHLVQMPEFRKARVHARLSPFDLAHQLARLFR